jgi:hypothetical protein
MESTLENPHLTKINTGAHQSDCPVVQEVQGEGGKNTHTLSTALPASKFHSPTDAILMCPHDQIGRLARYAHVRGARD